MNVNHNAAVCPAFLKGYCPEGNNCKLKHTKECQSYNKNGYCPDKLNGRCKLQHNKTSQHGKKISKKNKKQEKEEEEEEDDSSLPQQDYFSLLPNFMKDQKSPDTPSSEPTSLQQTNFENSSSEDEYSSRDYESDSSEEDDDLSHPSNISEVPVPDFLKL